MTTLLVTRHPGALAWLHAQGYADAVHCPHLDPDRVQAGDVVVGTLPVQLVADVCERGARYVNLSLDIPPTLRGHELSLEQLEACNARLEGFVARRVPLVRPIRSEG